MANVIQTAHGIVSSSGGTVSFPLTTQAGSVVVWMICWPNFVTSFFPSSDNAGNNVTGRTAGSTTSDLPATVGSESYFGVIRSPGNDNFCLPMRTLTLTGTNNGNVSVWMFELGGMLEIIGNFCPSAEYFTQQGGGGPWHDLNGSAQNPMNSSAGTSYGGPNDPFSHSYVPSDASSSYFIAACIAPTTQAGGTASITSVAAPFTLEPIQNGFGCAWKISGSGYDPVADRAVFTNGTTAFYSSVWIALLGAFVPPPDGNIIIQKVTSPTGSLQKFTINPNWKAAFTLTDGQSDTSLGLTPGVYSVTETPITSGAGLLYKLSSDSLGDESHWTTSVAVSSGDLPSAINLGSGQTITVTFTNTLVSGINSTYTTYGFVNAAKSTQNPLLGFHRKRFSETQMYIKGSGQLTMKAFPNYILKQDGLTFNPYVYTAPPVVLQVDPDDDIVRPLNISGNRVFVMYSTNAVGAAFSLSKTILCGTIDSFNTVNPNA